VNALWPRTAVATAAVMNLLGGEESIKKSRNTDVLSDSAYIILTSNSRQNTGNFYIVNKS
jgi:citronellol/citronellal dehydrogenase